MALAQKTPLRVLIVDDHPVVREGIRMCLKDHPTMRIVGEARDGGEAVRQVRALSPDIVLLDLVMPGIGGLEALPRLRKARPKARVIVFTVHNTREHVRDALAAKVDGYLLKDSSPAEYIDAIQQVVNGKFFLSPAAASHLISPVTRDPTRFGLTPRQFRYLQLASKGHPSAKIARFMKVKVSTVRTFQRKVFKKLGLENRAALSRFALETGL